jgi:hypothetical protein
MLTKEQVELNEMQPSLSKEGIGDKPESISVTDTLSRQLAGLTQGVKDSYSLGRKARIQLWRYAYEIYRNREILFIDNEKYRKSVAQYLIEVCGLSKTAAYDAIKVAKLMSLQGDKFLDIDHNDLIYMIIMIASAKEKFHAQLLSSFQGLDRDSLRDKIGTLRSGKSKKKKTNHVITQPAKWSEVSTSLNTKTYALKVEYTGDSKEDAEEYLSLAQRLLAKLDKDDIVALLEEEESTGLDDSDKEESTGLTEPEKEESTDSTDSDKEESTDSTDSDKEESTDLTESKSDSPDLET